jgi:dihydrodipicolinate synthase/N-acetylneuraminate lyase
VFNLDGTFRVKARSISFSNMEQDEFEKLYQAVLTVLMQKIPVLAQMGSDEIDRVTDLLIGYA